MVYEDKNRNPRAEMVEIKPHAQTMVKQEAPTKSLPYCKRSKMASG